MLPSVTLNAATLDWIVFFTAVDVNVTGARLEKQTCKQMS